MKICVISNWLEGFIYKWQRLICIILAICVVVIYANGYIIDVKSNIGNIVALLSSILVVITLILTILLYLNDKEKYIKAIAKNDSKNEIYKYVFKTILINILCILLVILIAVLKIDKIIIKNIIAFIGTYMFSYILIGSLYVLWFAIDIVSNINKPKDNGIR